MRTCWKERKENVSLSVSSGLCRLCLVSEDEADCESGRRSVCDVVDHTNTQSQTLQSAPEARILKLMCGFNATSKQKFLILI